VLVNAGGYTNLSPVFREFIPETFLRQKAERFI